MSGPYKWPASLMILISSSSLVSVPAIPAPLFGQQWPRVEQMATSPLITIPPLYAKVNVVLRRLTVYPFTAKARREALDLAAGFSHR
jgi:hypothetical protein